MSAELTPGRPVEVCIDAASFPHIFDSILDSVYEGGDASTLRALRLTSSWVKEEVDRRLFGHLVVKTGKVYAKHVALRDCDWSALKPRLVDVYDPFTEECLSRPTMFRFFEHHSYVDQPWVPEADTAIHVVDVTNMRPSTQELSCVVALSPRFKRTVVSVRYAQRLLCSPYYLYKPVEFSDDPTLEVVLILHAGTARRKAWPSSTKPNRPLHVVIEQALGLLRRSKNLRVTVVGRETWDMGWFDSVSCSWPLPESTASLTVADLWDICAGWYESDTSRLTFVSRAEFQDREPDLLRLSTEF